MIRASEMPYLRPSRASRLTARPAAANPTPEQRQTEPSSHSTTRHRSGVGFAAAGRAVTRLAREGRKYGISLALITQLPSELSSQALSQCGTVFALRLGHYLDHRFMETALPDAARGMLTALPSMRTQEAIAFGEGVPLPMHIRFDDLPPEHHPRSDSAEFSKGWQADTAGTDFLKEGVRRWREQSRAQSKK